jgi:hypothetical protein
MSNPKVRSQHQIVVGPGIDAFHFLDTKGNIIGWIDGTGTLQGNLTTNAGSNTNNIQGQPISPTPPQLNQTLTWNGVAWAPGTTATVKTVNFADAESPAGIIDGQNTSFTLSNAPIPSSSLQLFINGLLTISYVLNGNRITLATPPNPPNPPDDPTGDILEAYYRF